MFPILCKHRHTAVLHAIKNRNRCYSVPNRSLLGERVHSAIARDSSLRSFATTASAWAAQPSDNDKKPNGTKKLGTNILSSVFSGRQKLPKSSSLVPKSNIDVFNGPEIKTGEILKAMLVYIWPKNDELIRNRVVVALSLLIGSKVLNVSIPFLFKGAVDHLNVLSTATTPDTTLAICSSLVLGYGAARIGSTAFSELRNAVFARVAQHSIRRIATNVFMHMHQLDLNFHLNRQTGALSKVIDRGSRGINLVLSAIIFNIAPTIFEMSLVSGILWLKCGPEFAAIAMGCVASYAAFTLAITKWRTQFRVNMNRAENAAGNKAIDSLINFETVKYFNNEQHEARQYDKYLRNYEVASLKTASSLAFLNAGQQAIFSVGLTAIMYCAAQEIAKGNMTVGDLVMVNGLLFQLSIPLNFLGSVYREVRQAVMDMGSMFRLMNLEPAIQNRADAPFLAVSRDNASIEFRNVSFEYVADKSIFDALSLTIPAGKKIAVVGASGSGKSTLVRLLFRFYEPNAGSIHICNQNIADVDIDSLRRSIAIVPQECVLFNDTIRYNIHYGDLTKTTADVEQAARMAGLHDIIVKWPQQYETPVGERGLKLSGGEKQRVAIARAILKNAPILVFDEATSSLDSITEHNILQALHQATKNRTSICIAHRLSTIMDADEILVVENGRICEKGTHHQLIGSNGLYSRLWNAQNKFSQ